MQQIPGDNKVSIHLDLAEAAYLANPQALEAGPHGCDGDLTRGVMEAALESICWKERERACGFLEDCNPVWTEKLLLAWLQRVTQPEDSHRGFVHNHPQRDRVEKWVDQAFSHPIPQSPQTIDDLAHLLCNSRYQEAAFEVLIRTNEASLFPYMAAALCYPPILFYGLPEFLRSLPEGAAPAMAAALAKRAPVPRFPDPPEVLKWLDRHRHLVHQVLLPSISERMGPPPPKRPEGYEGPVCKRCLQPCPHFKKGEICEDCWDF